MRFCSTLFLLPIDLTILHRILATSAPTTRAPPSPEPLARVCVTSAGSAWRTDLLRLDLQPPRQRMAHSILSKFSKESSSSDGKEAPSQASITLKTG